MHAWIFSASEGLGSSFTSACCLSSSEMPRCSVEALWLRLLDLPILTKCLRGAMHVCFHRSLQAQKWDPTHICATATDICATSTGICATASGNFFRYHAVDSCARSATTCMVHACSALTSSWAQFKSATGTLQRLLWYK